MAGVRITILQISAILHLVKAPNQSHFLLRALLIICLENRSPMSLTCCSEENKTLAGLTSFERKM